MRERREKAISSSQLSSYSKKNLKKKRIFNIFCLVRGSLSSSANTLPGALRRGMQMFISLRGEAALHEPFEQLYGCKHSSDPLFL